MLFSQFDTNLIPIPWTISYCEGIYFLVKLRSEAGISQTTAETHFIPALYFDLMVSRSRHRLLLAFA